ncbi:sorting nexin-4 [Stylonychia lemnae]|uniref:Sorting nexin-4 n=1 Tax=Stylonychia lemnae TaxID=5949 RepID=A0A077ZMB9_STYLE|nr:sorting nexin-4 [Stylonychia lemnae]|eukprot:CDW71127.1 sorting nexin-4 [Stylonychia lemnae]
MSDNSNKQELRKDQALEEEEEYDKDWNRKTDLEKIHKAEWKKQDKQSAYPQNNYPQQLDLFDDNSIFHRYMPGFRLYHIKTMSSKGSVTPSLDPFTNEQSYNQHSLFEVERRFKDFKSFYLQLHENYPYCLIPPIPAKSYKDKISSDDSEFVENRRKQLLQFLLRIASHEVLGKCEELREFLHNKQFYHAGKQANIVNQVQSLFSKLPRIKNYILSKAQNRRGQSSMIPQYRNQLVLDVRLESEYQLQVVAASKVMLGYFTNLKLGLEREIDTLDKEVTATNNLIVHHRRFLEFRPMNNPLFSDRDFINEGNDNLELALEVQFERQRQIMLTFKNKLLEQVAFYQRYLRSVQYSIECRGNFIESYNKSKQSLSVDSQLQQYQQLKDITRSQIEEYKGLCKDIQDNVICGLIAVSEQVTRDDSKILLEINDQVKDRILMQPQRLDQDEEEELKENQD